MHPSPRRSLFTLGLFALLLAACAETPPPAEEPEAGAMDAPAATRSLYDRLGGQAAIQSVVDTFMTLVGADQRINARFAGTDLAQLNRLLVEQVCEATGGPCTYTGRTMREAHAGMGITEAEFNALVEDLVTSLDRHGVPEAEKSELLGALGAMKGDIVGT